MCGDYAFSCVFIVIHIVFCCVPLFSSYLGILCHVNYLSLFYLLDVGAGMGFVFPVGSCLNCCICPVPIILGYYPDAAPYPIC